MNKEGYEFSFAWLFALIVGAALIVFAIYASTRIIESKRFEAETLQAKQIGVLLNPTETNLETARLTTINARNTRIINDCDYSAARGIFGSQDISTQIKSGVGRQWTEEPGAQSSFHNKYIFSNGIVEAEKEFYVLSKPFKFPFKIADLLILTSDKESYCIVLSDSGEQGKIKKELNESLTLRAEFVNSANDCSDGSKKVCFGNSGCEINVDMGQKRIRKDGATLSYIESSDDDKYALLYAGIFSDSTIYECQIKRLMNGRAAQLAKLYNEKAQFFFANYQCGGSIVQNAFSEYEQAARRISNSANIIGMQSISEDLKTKNENLLCKIF